MPLLEREHPLQVLQEHARGAASGHGSLVLVTGEAGIGKTVLLRAFAQGRAAVLWGMCDPLLTPRPFGPLRDVAAQLDPAVPALLQAGAAQHEIFAAVLDALRGTPRVLVVEDLHWGDEATLDLVRFLARRIATLPLLLVLSYRDAVAVGHPLRTVLGDLVSSPDARRLQLAPLSRTAVARRRSRTRRRTRSSARPATAGSSATPWPTGPSSRGSAVTRRRRRARRRWRRRSRTSWQSRPCAAWRRSAWPWPASPLVTWPRGRT